MGSHFLPTMPPKMQQLCDHAKLAVSKGTGGSEESEEAIPLLGSAKLGCVPSCCDSDDAMAK